jgi:hypothetical protein
MSKHTATPMVFANSELVNNLNSKRILFVTATRKQEQANQVRPPGYDKLVLKDRFKSI